MAPLTLLFIARLRAFFFSACRARFSAERFLFTGAFAAKLIVLLLKKSYFIP
jgi:hypothetical protein